MKRKYRLNYKFEEAFMRTVILAGFSYREAEYAYNAMFRSKGCAKYYWKLQEGRGDLSNHDPQ